MSRQDLAYLSFNRGLVSRLGLARADVKRLALSAETMTNWKPRVLGSMMIRPGLGYLGSTYANAKARYLKHIFSTSDCSLVELTNNIMRIWIEDVVLTRPSVTTAVTNGTFAGNIAGWTDGSDAGATAPAYNGTSDTMQLASNGTARSIGYQTVTVVAANQNIEHALRITIYNGPLQLRVGATLGTDGYINETTLETGTHSLAFTPTGNFVIQFGSTLERATNITSCTVEAAGVVTLPTPWTEALLPYVRSDQSGDVLFVACQTIQQRRIERRGTRPHARSWSIVLYRPEDGPFQLENTGPTTLTPSVLSGNGTLTSSVPMFRTSHVGGIFSLSSTGQVAIKNMAALNDATAAIRVTGVGTDRTITAAFTNFTGGGRTAILQRSFDNATWVAVAGKSWTADTAEAYADGLDNQIVYYRLLLSVVGTAGTTVANISIPTGSATGIARVTGWTSTTVVDIEVLASFGGTSATDTWAEGEWSPYRGWPSAVAFYEGRLWWTGKNGIWGSETDGFDVFSDLIEGDAAPLNRSIGSGPVDIINWILPLQRLILGAEGAEFSVRSSSLDEPLTPTNFNIKTASTQGSAAVEAVKIDNQGVYVQRGGARVFELTISGDTFDYTSQNLTAVVPEIGDPGIVRMDVQRQVDTAVHCLRTDGIAACVLFDKVENVTCWYLVESDGASGVIEDVVVLPGGADRFEDRVYYAVKRTINGSVVRYLEKWAQESECRGDAQLCKLADSFVTYSGAATTVITGLSHLEGQQVVVWADGADVGTDTDEDGVRTLPYTVTGGQITLATAASNVVVGLYYEAPWKSGKLLQLQAQRGTPLSQHKRIGGLGAILADTHFQGLRYGLDFDNLQDMPQIDRGAQIAADTVFEAYDGEPFFFDGEWNPDSRVCVLASAPRPCTILALTAEVQMNET